MKAEGARSWRLVPLEPTTDMKKVAHNRVAIVTPDGTWALALDEAARIYKYMVEAAPPGPGGTGIRKEITPGSYGPLEVGHAGPIFTDRKDDVGVHVRFDPTEGWTVLRPKDLRAAAATLIKLADALEDGK